MSWWATCWCSSGLWCPYDESPGCVCGQGFCFFGWREPGLSVGQQVALLLQLVEMQACGALQQNQIRKLASPVAPSLSTLRMVLPFSSRTAR